MASDENFENLIAEIDAELGPIKYISELFYGESTKESVDRAVRIIILLLIFVVT